MATPRAVVRGNRRLWPPRSCLPGTLASRCHALNLVNATLAHDRNSQKAGRRASFAFGPDQSPKPGQRIVELVHHALLERDDGVVGDGDPIGTDLGAALGDVE